MFPTVDSTPTSRTLMQFTIANRHFCCCWGGLQHHLCKCTHHGYSNPTTNIYNGCLKSVFLKTMVTSVGIPFPKLTVRTWKSRVGRGLLSFWDGLFSGIVLASGRVVTLLLGSRQNLWEFSVLKLWSAGFLEEDFFTERVLWLTHNKKQKPGNSAFSWLFWDAEWKRHPKSKLKWPPMFG